jgi:hypothetical protein
VALSLLALIVAFGGSAAAVYAASGGDALIAQRSLSGNRLRLNTVTDKEVVDLVWHPLTLLHGWVNYNTSRVPAWALDAQGIVHFRGAIANGTSLQFARLPVAVRPTAVVCVATNLTGAAPGRINIHPDGSADVGYYNAFSDAQTFTSLDGVTYTVN